MKIFHKFFIIIFFGFLVFFIAPNAFAATLQFSPNSGKFSQGQTFTISIFTSSTNQAMNAASGSISFPPDKIEVVSLSKAGSIFNLWVREPSFSNSAGTINFEGIVLNPGFTGASGKIMSVTFRAKEPGVATVKFSSGSVLANDGKGTNIISALGTASYGVDKIHADSAPPIITSPTVIAGTPLAPQITSLTHPDPNAWYADGNPSFSWQLPSDATGVSIGINKNPTGDPGSVSDGMISQKSFTDLDDGVWYFHVKIKNKNGWGAISHYRVQVDTSPPKTFIVNELPRDDKTNPIAKLEFKVEDDTSQVFDFDIIIGGGIIKTWSVKDKVSIASSPEDASSGYIYTTPVLKAGNNELIITARDQAGNGNQQKIEIFVEPLPMPKVTSYSESINANDFFIVKGEARPGSNVFVIFTDINGFEEVFQSRATEEGFFTIVSNDNDFKQGGYEFVMYIEDDRGARSETTSVYTVLVEPTSLQSFGNKLIAILTVLIPVIALLVILILLVWYAWYRFIALKKKIIEDAEETDHNINIAIENMRNDLQRNVDRLKSLESKKPLTKKQEQCVQTIKIGIDEIVSNIEKYISEEIKDLGSLEDELTDVKDSKNKKRKFLHSLKKIIKKKK